MVEEARVVESEPSGYVRFWVSGEPAKGEYHCSECGYGVTVYRELPTCPMCGGKAWEQTTWSPLTRALDSQAKLND
jgi:rubrerythrin